MSIADNSFNNPSSFGAFGPSTNVWDVGEIYAAKDLNEDLKEILVRLYQNLNLMSVLLNIKDTGLYDLSEFVNGQVWFPNPAIPATSFDTTDAIYRQNYRKVINFGPLPNGVKPVAHEITVTDMTSFTRIYGAASDQTALTYLPLPYVNLVAANQIQVDVDATFVTITTGIDYSAYTVAYIVVEYLQT